VEINLKDYLRIKEAARLIGVSEGTLRNWGREGKIPTHRHPINGYRLYRKADLEALLKAIHQSAMPAPPAARKRHGLSR
jgi:excisionase family DNA binding protein